MVFEYNKIWMNMGGAEDGRENDYINKIYLIYAMHAFRELARSLIYK
jgi:hypothetical protein